MTTESLLPCPYCRNPAELVTGKEIYPNRQDLFDLNFWRCEPCGAYVGCHKKQGDGSQPLGRLANAELRKAKTKAHAAFDPIWQGKEMKRSDAYAWLAKQLGAPVARTHIGEFNVADCMRVVKACENINDI